MPSTDAPPDGSVVRLANLTRSFGSFRALDEVSISFPEGSVGLLGPNGAGKTTLLRTLLGLLPADSGSASVLGIDAARSPLALRRRVGYMPESDCYIPGLKGVRLVAFAGELSGLPRRNALTRAHEVLYYVGLEEVRYRKVDEYSQGMRQRLRLAQALVHDPDLLFLDEPTSGLDPDGRREMLYLIRDLTARVGKHVVLSSHLLPDVEETCDHVVVLAQGRVAGSGSMDEFRGVGSGLYQARVVGDVDAVVAKLEGTGHAVTDRKAENLTVSLPGGTRPLFDAALGSSAQVRELKEISPSLEDALLDMLEPAPPGDV